MQKKLWLMIEILLGIALLVLLIWFGIRKIEDYRYIKAQDEFKSSMSIVELDSDLDEENIIPIEEVEENKELEEKLQEAAKAKVEELKAEYPSIVGIIEIPKTEILYPIVQGNDNQFYLDHDKEGNYHAFGEVFLDSRNTSSFTDKNSVVYGHNVRSAKTIFNELLQYENEDFFNNHKEIRIYTQEGLKTYEVISVFKAKPEEPYRERLFNSQEEFKMFINKYQNESSIKTEDKEFENLLTLSTCFNNNYRFVIQAGELE